MLKFLLFTSGWVVVLHKSLCEKVYVIVLMRESRFDVNMKDSGRGEDDFTFRIKRDIICKSEFGAGAFVSEYLSTTSHSVIL